MSEHHQDEGRVDPPQDSELERVTTSLFELWVIQQLKRIEGKLDKMAEMTQAEFDAAQTEMNAAFAALLAAEATRDAAVLKAINDFIAKHDTGVAVDSAAFSADLANLKALAANAAALTQTATAADPGSTVVTPPPSAATASTTTLTAPATSAAGADIALSVAVAPAQGTATPTGTVQFMDGTNNIGEPVDLDANGDASTVFPAAPVGTYSFSAVYSGDDANATSTSAPVVTTVA